MLLSSFSLQCKGYPGDCVSVVWLNGVLFRFGAVWENGDGGGWDFG